MARTTTRVIVIDGEEHKIAKLTIGTLRELADQEKDLAPDDAFGTLTVNATAVLRSMKRADPACALDLPGLLDLLDEEDLRAAHSAVMALTTGREAAAVPPAGEPQSP